MARSSWGLDTDRELDWRQFAACGPDNADWFFVTGMGGHLSHQNRAALEICRSCSVRSECLADTRSVETVVEQSRIAGGEVILGRRSRATKGTHPRWTS